MDDDLTLPAAYHLRAMVVLKLNLGSLSKPLSIAPTPTSTAPATGIRVDGSRPTTALPPPPGTLPRIRLKSAASTSTKIRIRNQRDAGLGYDSEASDKEDDPAIEEQIILRCRPGEDAEYLRSCLERKEVPDIMIKFKEEDPHRAVVRIRKNLYAAKLVDLPTIIESSKTLDRKSLYKTADICQMLIIGDPIPHEETILAYPSKSSDYIYPHGLTPPLRWVRKRRFRKRISNRTIEQVEAKLDELLKADKAAVHTSYEVLTPHSHPATRDTSLAPSDFGSPYPHTPTAAGEEDLFEGSGGSEVEDADFADELEREMAEHARDVAGEVATPIPTPGATEPVEEESEESESDGEIGEGGAAAERNEEEEKLQKKREEISELEMVIMQRRIAVAGIVNPIVRGRMLEGLGRLESELMLKKRQLEEDEEEG